MIQTGDPSGSGKGGQSIWGKPFADEIRSTLKVCLFYSQPQPSLTRYRPPCAQFNNRGILAMANSGADTNKSQFFITFAKQPHLDGKYTIFGKVHSLYLYEVDGISRHDRSSTALTQRWTPWSACQSMRRIGRSTKSS